MTTKTIDNLTSKQNDYAVFLPALSSFYATYVGKQRHDPSYIVSTRLPADFENGVEGLNWLNPNDGYFKYKWALYSAGHANLDTGKNDPKEDMVRNRDPNSFILGDSGGFQIGKGVWEGNWKDPLCPKAQKKREQVLSWMDAYMDRGMILDIPAWVARSPAGQKATGITSFEEAVSGTYINNDYFIKNRNGNCKFLNVLQGENHTEADIWYDRMKKYCDPKQYPNDHFNGWAMGGQNMCDVHLALKRIVALRFDGLLESGLHDWMHFLGTSKLEWALLLTDIQRAVRKHHNENFTISFDCASPFLATANGQIYYDVVTPDRGKWSYQMQPSVDNKKYATDTRAFRDAVLQDNIFDTFLESPVSERLTIKDVCIYKPGDLNKIGKEGKTSWDSFSYALQMGHNVWTHIHAVQEANRQCDSGKYPDMLVATSTDRKNTRLYDRAFFRDVVDDIFATSDRGKAEALIEHYNRYWMSIVGTRGYIGKKTVNANTMFNSLFQEDDPAEEEHHIDDSGLDETNLNQLETENV
jgi:hypothetical protein